MRVRDRELDRRARAGGLVGVRERDVGEAERGERAGELVGGGGAERRGQREVDLGGAERLQVGGERGDARRVAGAGGGRVDSVSSGVAAREPAHGLRGVGRGDHGHAERLELGGEVAAAVGRAQRDDDDLVRRRAA